MKISNLRTENIGSRVRVAATVTWEDCDRPTHDIYFETDEAFADSLSCNPDAFLVGCIVPAMHYGEKRVLINEEICPQLRSGLITAMSLLRHWYYSPDRELVHIEAKVRKGLLNPKKQTRAAFFFSGGVDSFATLRANRLNFPLEHPWSIKDGLLVYGLELDDPEAFRYVLRSLSAVSEEAGITLVPVYTNLYLNYRQEDSEKGFSFWTYKFQSAALSAVAHAFEKRLSVISIASTLYIPDIYTKDGYSFGTHPLLDHNYSSSNLQILYDGVTLSRFAKTKMLSDWDTALQHLRTCNQYKKYRPDMLNCGQCEKCLRTMLALLALGVLDKTGAFPYKDISPELIKKIDISSLKYTFAVSRYQDLISALAERGRHDLAHVLEKKIIEFHRQKRISNYKAMVKRFDSRCLGGILVRLKRLIPN